MQTTHHLQQLERRQMLSSTWDPSIGVGAIGDSYSDEYEFYAPDRSTARNFVELLAEERDVNFGDFTVEDRGAPRHQGYAHNWAIDAARSAGAAEQTAGLAAQVAAGDVEVVFVFIGGNDFRDVFLNLDPASATPEGVQAAIGAAVQGALVNVFTAVGTLRAVDADVKLVVATLPNVAMLPEIRAAVQAGLLPDALVDAVDAGIDAFNHEVRTLADAIGNVALADVDGLMDWIFAGRKFKVAGVAIDRDVPANDPTHLWLADGIHAGTIGQALLANVFIDAVNEEFGAGIKRFRPPEILREAGVPSAARGTRSGWASAGAAAAGQWRRHTFGAKSISPAISRCMAAETDPLRRGYDVLG
jgi:hypothetical protein